MKVMPMPSDRMAIDALDPLIPRINCALMVL
ncbi:MAG: hypothetical protein RLY20_2413 [Verrucomicrobiota bacterium]|jgi:hypothetical protein